MLVVWMVAALTTQAWGQQSHNTPRFEWGWQLQAPGSDSSATAGQYYVRLPQAEHQVRYTADHSGYHSAVNIATSGDHHTHQASFALGQQALNLLTNEAPPLPQTFSLNPNATPPQPPQYIQTINEAQQPLIYLLQQQYTAPSNDQQHLTNNYQTQQHYETLPNYYNTENVVTTPARFVVQHPTSQINQNDIPRADILSKEERKDINDIKTEESSSPLSRKDAAIQLSNLQPVLQVFKDVNCTDHKADKVEEVKSNKITSGGGGINGHFGEKLDGATYRGAVSFKVEAPATERQNSRNERVLYYESSTAASTDVPNIQHLGYNDGITRLVASTQDLITNDDLLTINHAAEKYGQIHNDDIIKPQSKFNQQPTEIYEFRTIPRSRITVKAKIGNIVNSEIEHLENNGAKEQVLQTSANEYKFGSPIVVQDSTLSDFKEQVVNNIVSTVAPYLDDGYEVSSIRNTVDNNRFMEAQNEMLNYRDDYEMVNVTPRPIGTKYLAPITVALRLHNANYSELFNTIDDHEGSDSEIIADTIKPEEPKNVGEKTIVEIQESISGPITHINDVEYHKQYLEDGLQHDEATRSLLHQYVQALEDSRKIQENMNENLYKYGAMTENNSNGQEFKDSNDHLQLSENMLSEVGVHPNFLGNNQRKEFFSWSPKRNKVIQPIIIEKEVPVTKYVDRFVEKPVPYPEPYEVIKEVEKSVVVPFPVNVEKIIDRPYEVTRYIDRPYPVQIPVQVPQPYPVEIQVPYPVQQKVFVDRPVHIPYTVEKVVEKQLIHQVPVPTPVAVPVQQKVLYPVPVNRPVPVPYAVEKPVHFETIVEKPVAVPYPVPTAVPIPVKYPQPYPVDRVVEKKVPYPVQVDRIVEKRVPYEVQVPVEKIVEKIVEKPVVVTKYVDKPYPVETRVPYPVEKIVEKKVPYPVHVPVEVKVPYPVEKQVQVPIRAPYPTVLPVPYRVPYAPQYLPRYTPEQHQNGVPPPHLQQTRVIPQYRSPPHPLQNLYHQKGSEKRHITSIPWGKHYASSYQYINNSDIDLKRNQLEKYIDYVTNARNQYYGPPPLKAATDPWQDRNNYAGDFKVRRTDRNPKNLRIEYGGFKPPLIPSLEVDLDGVPIYTPEK